MSCWNAEHFCYRTISEACALSSDIASCTYSIVGGGGSTGVESASILKSMYQNVTITAGFEALYSASSEAAAQAAAATGELTAMVASPTTSSAGTSGTGDGTANSAAIQANRKIGEFAIICCLVTGLLSW